MEEAHLKYKTKTSDQTLISPIIALVCLEARFRRFLVLPLRPSLS